LANQRAAGRGRARRRTEGRGARLLHRRANRQYVPIPAPELWRFVGSREKIYVAFPMEGGYPHVSPMWFCVLDRKIYLRTHDYKVKTRLAESGRACCTLDEGTRYVELRGATIWGRTRVVADPGLAARVEEAMDAKYELMQWKPAEMPPWWVEERKAEARAYIEITPEKVSSWDNARVALGTGGPAKPHSSAAVPFAPPGARGGGSKHAQQSVKISRASCLSAPGRYLKARQCLR
jgi:nitroimidazol reductase NimA-like FMN-containing flavoprotein (pyridoxamine 5'-phosphate oxidase superfamily)